LYIEREEHRNSGQRRGLIFLGVVFGFLTLGLIGNIARYGLDNRNWPMPPPHIEGTDNEGDPYVDIRWGSLFAVITNESDKSVTNCVATVVTASGYYTKHGVSLPARKSTMIPWDDFYSGPHSFLSSKEPVRYVKVKCNDRLLLSK
jgi:hypothetical protein